MKRNYIIPIFVPHLGCKNDCSFCNQKSISGQIKEVTKDDVKETIEMYLNDFNNDILIRVQLEIKKLENTIKEKG